MKTNSNVNINITIFNIRKTGSKFRLFAWHLLVHNFLSTAILFIDSGNALIQS